ncbi:MAG: hypothetical protein C4520_19930 [Candidatus Abyssobacteria bacterium SURF_5]|uniref:Uncharacterized protein n=1 Tax=Abyssobacteria bacterium (strain SURF_5) TaxID=2093360 RepID=A0A3A4N0D7_ABYX5|nr:MAG: hypothetical protein C4520_19930 [Candidatus Abyssubacteria bacterium SURF_5]
MKKSCLAVAFSIAVVAGCASQPVPTTLDAIFENPAQYRNENVEFSAQVLENPPPSGDLYRTWTFLVGHPDIGRILVTEAGYNPATINKAYHLVEEAAQAGEPVTITGELRVGPHRSLKAGAEIDLRSVSYQGITIDTNEGPYVGGFYSPYYYYPYYPRPFLWDYHYYPYGYGWWGRYVPPAEESEGYDGYSSYAGYYDAFKGFEANSSENTQSDGKELSP